MRTLEACLRDGARELGIPLPEQAAADFCRYYDFLLEKNRVMDLTAVSGEEDTARRHFLDSLSLLRCGEGLSGARIIDVGSGAGFPGLPLLLAQPDVQLTLLDSLGKRVDFLRELTALLGRDVQCIHARAEEQAKLEGWRESFDYAVSRAVARLSPLCELCLPFVRPGGALLAMKARDCAEEVAEAAHAIEVLGARLERSVEISVAGVPRSILVIRKTAPTPAEYPRRFAKIQKKPL